ncbi:MAG: DUF3800 domain-containing protein [Candidatus Dormiibacterota bacterium]
MEVNVPARFKQPRYRMFVDEVGNVDMNVGIDSPERYLSLTGVMAGLDHVAEFIEPQLEALKRRHFPDHRPERPVILHRKDLIHKSGAFLVLRDEAVCRVFDAQLLAILEGSSYAVVTVVIDKFAHKLRYPGRSAHPYHYCMMVLLERYVFWLSTKGAAGDVLAESRGHDADAALKEAYRNLVERGNRYLDAIRFARLTSQELKLEKKQANVAGLQVADVLAFPSHSSMLDARLGRDRGDVFGSRICDVLSRKYRRTANGRIEGVGQKWLP